MNGSQPGHHEPIDFDIMLLTRDEMDELKALCHVAGVKLRGFQNHFGGFDVVAVGPRGHRYYSTKDLHPMTFETMRQAVLHAYQCES